MARARTPNFNPPQTSSGNSVTTSIRIGRPVHAQDPALQVDLAQILGYRRNPVLNGSGHHHHGVARSVNEVVELAQLHSLQIPYPEPEQIAAVVLALARR